MIQSQVGGDPFVNCLVIGLFLPFLNPPQETLPPIGATASHNNKLNFFDAQSEAKMSFIHLPLEMTR